jgi:hypothetical protein
MVVALIFLGLEVVERWKGEALVIANGVMSSRWRVWGADFSSPFGRTKG